MPGDEPCLTWQTQKGVTANLLTFFNVLLLFKKLGQKWPSVIFMKTNNNIESLLVAGWVMG